VTTPPTVQTLDTFESTERLRGGRGAEQRGAGRLWSGRGAVAERSGAVAERSGAVAERSGAVAERSGAVAVQHHDSRRERVTERSEGTSERFFIDVFSLGWPTAGRPPQGVKKVGFYC